MCYEMAVMWWCGHQINQVYDVLNMFLRGCIVLICSALAFVLAIESICATTVQKCQQQNNTHTQKPQQHTGRASRS